MLILSAKPPHNFRHLHPTIGPKSPTSQSSNDWIYHQFLDRILLHPLYQSLDVKTRHQLCKPRKFAVEKIVREENFLFQIQPSQLFLLSLSPRRPLKPVRKLRQVSFCVVDVISR